MCGIAGILNLTEGAVPEERLLRSMLGMIRHRGPDQFGIYLGASVALGNARLSIIDLEGGQQPISNEDGTIWVVFNGEIFNYVELKAELEGRGHRFSTHCDTEVIAHAYEEYGAGCLERFNGQFAVAIWNERERSLLLGRDRLGVRPLFYCEKNGRLIFGSEIKAILACPEVERELDPIALDQVFTYWSPQSPRTCFKGIQELPPAHYMVARDGAFKIRRYWDLTSTFDVERSTFDVRPDRSIDDYAAEFRDLLTDAVRIRLRADVPVGAYLSGGLDSSTIAAVVRNLGVSHLDTFSIAFNDPQFDESEHQRRMARFLGTDHQVVQATHADIGRVFPDVVWHTEAPLLRTAPAPMFLLSKLVHERNYKVVLTGEGADEFLGGYDIFKETMVRRFWARSPESRWRASLLRRLYPDVGGLASASGAYLKAFFGQGLTETDRSDYSHMIRWRNTRRAARFFSKELLAAIERDRTMSGGKPWSPGHRLTGLQQAQVNEITTFLSPYLLSSQGDRVAMAHAVEGRFPFLDVRVVEFCNRLPPTMKLRGLREKRLLRRVAAAWLPAEILQRGKRPYRAPIHRSFFNEPTEEWVRDVLSAAALGNAGLFNPMAVGQLVQRLDRGQALGETDDMALAGILSTQLLDRQFTSIRKCDALDGRDDVKVVLSRERDVQLTR
jgi:asparagine synthase (glutamine-hydrolysing)